MKKILLVILVVMLYSFTFLEISQAGECIYLYSWEGRNYYYDPSEAQYSGDIVSFVLCQDDCSSDVFWFIEIDCATRMIREADFLLFEDTDWESIRPGSYDDTLRIKLCR
ncbi:MAG: hypothetical protein A2Y65_06785 [Deltaproteobacteria bacterium RBG_13_52_11]|nr:MAG: hypothetical protein A2Y65_06785 [Deltaproteobacteria bacterium RBG_13_52_11]